MTTLESNVSECRALLRQLLSQHIPTIAFAEVQELLGVPNASSVRHFLKKHGIKPTSHGRYPRLKVLSAING